MKKEDENKREGVRSRPREREKTRPTSTLEEEKESYVRIHEEACRMKQDTYKDPTTGLVVFTRYAHKKRGTCCGCGCRHCPYGKKSIRGGDIEDWNEKEEEEKEEKTTTKKMSVTTKTGDAGTSSLFNGERVSKSNVVFDALGDIDELSANIGYAYEHCLELNDSDDLCRRLLFCTKQLVRIGSVVATPRQSSRARHIERTTMDDSCVKQLDRWIRETEDVLPRLTTFLLPIGGKACASLHVARAVCRRAERAVVRLPRCHTGDVPRTFMNRLSDFLFVSARLAVAKERDRKEVRSDESSAFGTATKRRKSIGVAEILVVVLAWIVLYYIAMAASDRSASRVL